MEKQKTILTRKEKAITILSVSLFCIFLCFFVTYLSLGAYKFKAKTMGLFDSGKNCDVLFIGDSLVEYMDSTRYFKKDEKVVNRGLAGITAKELMKYMDDVVISARPKKVIVLVGINDIRHGDSVENVVHYISEMVANIKNNTDSAIYIQSLYPINDKKDKKNNIMIREATSDKIIETNIKLKKLCDDNGYIYCDIHKNLVDEDGKLKKEYSVDGIHVNTLAYEQIVNDLREIVLH